MKNNTYNYFNMYGHFWGPDAPSYTTDKLTAQRNAMTRTLAITSILTAIMVILTACMAAERIALNFAVPYLGTILTIGLAYMTIKVAIAGITAYKGRKYISELLDNYDEARANYFANKNKVVETRQPFSNPLRHINWPCER